MHYTFIIICMIYAIRSNVKASITIDLIERREDEPGFVH